MTGAGSPSLTSAFLKLMLRWLIALEILLILGVMVVFAWALRWNTSDPMSGAAVAISELRAQAEVTPTGEVILGNTALLDRLRQDNPGFWYRVIGPRNQIVSGPADAPDSDPLLKPGDHGSVTRLDGTGTTAIMWTGDGQLLFGASGAPTRWQHMLRFLWLEASGYVLTLLLLPLLLGVLLIALSRKAMRMRLMALRPPKMEDLAQGQRLPPSALPAELESFARSYNAALDLIEAAMARLDTLSGEVAHEFRTPLTRLWMHAESLPPGGAREDILAELRLLTTTLGALLNLAKSGLEDATHEDVELTAFARGIVQELAPAAIRAGRGIAFEDLAPSTVRTNAALSGIIIRNLVENAIRHTRPGDRIVIRAGDGVVTVEDTGTGLPSTAAMGSRGIGLKLTQRIAAHLGAAVTFGEGPGGGLSVSLRFG